MLVKGDTGDVAHFGAVLLPMGFLPDDVADFGAELLPETFLPDDVSPLS